MAHETQHPLLRYIRRIAARGSADTPDAALLERFVAQRDEDAFAELVQRHGPVVWGVCRRVLAGARDVQIAEDAFQATFLVLLHKARALSRQELLGLGNWLFGVAYRTATKAKSNAHRDRARQGDNEPVAPDDPAEETSRRELRRVLDEELARLPEKYRAPVVLCYLEGHTQEEVARLLGCPRATVATRLIRACERLRAGLGRRGVSLSAGTLAAALAQSAESACLPASLVASTVKAASLLVPGSVTAALVSTEVLMLTKGVMKAMFLSKLIRVAALVLVAVALAAGTGIVMVGSRAGDPDSKEKKEKPPAKRPEEEKATPATKFANAFLTNEALADETLTGQRIAVIGRVARIVRLPGEKKSLQGYAVTMYTDIEGSWIFLEFGGEARKQLAALRAEQRVTIEGRCVGKTNPTVPPITPLGSGVIVQRAYAVITFRDCKIISVEKAEELPRSGPAP